LGGLTVEVTADTRKFELALDQARRAAAQTSQQIEATFKTAGQASAAAAGQTASAWSSSGRLIEATFGRLTAAALAVKNAFVGMFTPIRPAAQADLARVQGSMRTTSLGFQNYPAFLVASRAHQLCQIWRSAASKCRAKRGPSQIGDAAMRAR
jgi:hypothetical protein